MVAPCATCEHENYTGRHDLECAHCDRNYSEYVERTAEPIVRGCWNCVRPHLTGDTNTMLCMECTKLNQHILKGEV